MSDHLVPLDPSQPPMPAAGESHLQPWQDARPLPPPMPRSPLERPIAAIRRYKWLALAVALLGTGAGAAATRLVEPSYEVAAKIMIAADSPLETRLGPIRGTGLLASDDWVNLMRTNQIVDSVVVKLALYVMPDKRADAWLFRSFGIKDQFKPGRYELVIDRPQKRWSIVHATGTLARGQATDSVGARELGFRWVLPPEAFNGAGEYRAKFTVSTPREAANRLINRASITKSGQSNFLQLGLRDRDGKLAADIVNTWAAEFVSVATTFKRRKLSEMTRTLDLQLRDAKRALDSAEIALSNFRVQTITKPRDEVPQAGVIQTTDPAIRSYFDRKQAFENTKNDIRTLEGLLAMLSRDTVPVDALLQVPNVSGPAGQSLRDALTQYRAAEMNVRRLRENFQDEHPDVKAALATLATFRTQVVPNAVNALIGALRVRASDDSLRLASLGENLQQAPENTIMEEQLRRAREQAATLQTDLQKRFGEAQLAELSATPDVTILDPAVAPLLPTKNTASRLILLGIVGGIGAAFGLAILLDKIDGRLRYPEQATDELGLPIAATIPRFPKGGVSQNSPEQMFQLIESFRSLRMTVMHASQHGVSLAVSSPAPSEGKSLISANLAMSFADAGLRTILVDGDTRRGALNEMFGLKASPGLTELLAGKTTLTEAIRQTTHDKLAVLPAGIRQRRSPELLTSPRLQSIVNELRGMYDAVIFDTPPLAAGIDGYSIAAATGSLIVVLRVGQTERRMAVEKLRMFERLPVDIIGAVLNGIEFQGQYEYYGYVPGYEAVDEEPGTALMRQEGVAS